MTDLVDLDSVRLDNLARYIRAARPADGTEDDTAMVQDELLTLEDVATYLKVSKQHAWRLTRPGQTKGEPMPTIRFGHSVRVRKTDLDAWLERRTAARA